MAVAFLLTRKELIRLAKLWLPVSHFDKTKLSKNGYIIKIEEQDVKLPCPLARQMAWPGYPRWRKEVENPMRIIAIV
jgi:hypothetical protein